MTSRTRRRHGSSRIKTSTLLIVSILLNCVFGILAARAFGKCTDLESSLNGQASIATAASATVADTAADIPATDAAAVSHQLSTPIHLTLSGSDFLLDREGRIGYADLERELEACGATGLTFSHEAENFDVAKDADADETNLEISTLAGVFPNTKGDTRFEIRTELEPPAANERDYHLTTTIVFKDKDNRCFTATRERTCLFEEFAESEDADSGLFPTVLFYDEAKGIMLTEDQVNALKWVAMNFLPSRDEVDAPKSESWFTDPVMAINLPAISDYLIES